MRPAPSATSLRPCVDRCDRSAGSAHLPVDPSRSPHDDRHISHLPRRRTRRGQDVRDAERGQATQGPRHGCHRRLRRDARSSEHRGADRRSRGRPAKGDRVQGLDVRGDGRRRDPRAGAAGRAGRRARSHERSRLPQHETVRGRAGAARSGDHRHLDVEHPAPRVGERRRRADHGRQAARDDPGRDRPQRRPGRARRHGSRGDQAAHGARQHLPVRSGSTPRSATTFAPETSPHCASSPCCGSRTGSRRGLPTTGTGTGSTGPGRRGSGFSSRSRGRTTATA